MVIGINDRSYNLVGGEVILLNLLTIGAKDIDLGSQIFPKYYLIEGCWLVGRQTQTKRDALKSLVSPWGIGRDRWIMNLND